MTKKKILIICSHNKSLINFRGDFIRELIINGFEVFCAAPNFQEEIVHKIHDLGAKTIPFNLERTGLNPYKDLKTIFELKRIILKYKIDIVFPYTIKPVVYGSIAANKLGVPTFSLITGLGFTFSGVSAKAKILQKVTQYLYKKALRKNKVVIFQNQDDEKLFLDKKIVSKSQKTSVVDGSGINLKRFKYRLRNIQTGDSIKFVLVARLIKEKGVGLFLEAAQYLKPKYPNIEFHIIGAPPENNSSAISLKLLQKLDAEKTIKYHGYQKNVIEKLSMFDIFVLPSYYREGVPRSILESLSMGMPIITTEMPGCKETVVHEENGFLIPPKKLESLINSMQYFIKKPNVIGEYGKKSRALAESKFDVDIINRDLIKIINDNLQ